MFSKFNACTKYFCCFSSEPNKRSASSLTAYQGVLRDGAINPEQPRPVHAPNTSPPRTVGFQAFYNDDSNSSRASDHGQPNLHLRGGGGCISKPSETGKTASSTNALPARVPNNANRGILPPKNSPPGAKSTPQHYDDLVRGLNTGQDRQQPSLRLRGGGPCFSKPGDEEEPPPLPSGPRRRTAEEITLANLRRHRPDYNVEEVRRKNAEILATRDDEEEYQGRRFKDKRVPEPRVDRASGAGRGGGSPGDGAAGAAGGGTTGTGSQRGR